MTKTPTFNYMQDIKRRVKHWPTHPMCFSFNTVERTGFDEAARALPEGWRCILWQDANGTDNATIIGPKYKWTLTPDAVSNIERILKTKCRLTADAARACVLDIDDCAHQYAERVRLWGKHPDPSRVRDEMGALRRALRMSESAKDVLMYASWKRMSEHPDRAVMGRHGESLWEPAGLLQEIDAWAKQVEAWIDPKRGRPESLQARQLIRHLAKTFTQHTSRRATATPSSAFSDIVCDVLDSKNPRKLIKVALSDPTGIRDQVL